MERIDVDVFVKQLGDNTGGMSKPVHIIGSNGKEYLLKNQNVYNEQKKDWEEWDCMFLQEVLVYRIAKYLGISVPDCAIASVDDSFLAQAPSLRFSHRYVPGYHFASKIVEGVENNLKDGYYQLLKMGKPYIKKSWNSFFNNISNKDDIPKIIVLDLLTANFDRFGNTGNLLIASENGDRTLYCIDHGHCFYGSSWANMYKKNMMMSVGNSQQYTLQWVELLLGSTGSQFPMSGLGEVFRALDQYIDVSDPDNHCFHDVVLLAEGINASMVDNWLYDLPDEWFVEKQIQIPMYKRFIVEQKNLLRIFLNIMAGQKAFQSYVGGVLSWNVKLTGTP